MGKEHKAVAGSIHDLVFDDKNFNKHTEFGMGLLEKSLRQYGAARSIVVDKEGRIICGNGIAETASDIGMEKTIVIETTGEELVVVKRTDIELDSAEGRGIAFADNATAAADLDWDNENLKQAAEEYEISPDEWGVHDWQESEAPIDLNSFFGEEQQGEKEKGEKITVIVNEDNKEELESIKEAVRAAVSAWEGVKVK